MVLVVSMEKFTVLFDFIILGLTVFGKYFNWGLIILLCIGLWGGFARLPRHCFESLCCHCVCLCGHLAGLCLSYICLPGGCFVSFCSFRHDLHFSVIVLCLLVDSLHLLLQMWLFCVSSCFVSLCSLCLCGCFASFGLVTFPSFCRTWWSFGSCFSLFKNICQSIHIWTLN